MNTAYLLIGGNVGNRKNNLQKAIQLINESCAEIIEQSSIYQTAAWGVTDQPDFFNQVLVLQTALQPQQLLTQLLLIEEKMGRIRTIKMGPRTIDIDILLMNDLIINSPSLTLPHPALPQRKFALIPLNEVAPTLIHPVEKKTITALLQLCTDTLNVQKISANA